MIYQPKANRYDTMKYQRCGKSGLRLPRISMGLWQNFGQDGNFDEMERMVHTAFDLGITHFDLANNYGHPWNGSAEINFGKILDRGMRKYRDEMCISTKAGYEMWDGPYGDRNGSRKYLIASLDQSLRRMNLEYVDIFYHHVYDPDTPLEETAHALDQVVRQGKALYVGISNYNAAQTHKMHEILQHLGTPFIVNQPSYSMLNRWIEEDGLDEYAVENGIGLAVFSPLSQGFLTDRYLNGIPDNSRIGKGNTWLGEQLDSEKLEKIKKLNHLAQERGQKLSQMALAWCLHNPAVVTVLAGASRTEQIQENVRTLEHLDFSEEELLQIRNILEG